MTVQQLHLERRIYIEMNINIENSHEFTKRIFNKASQNNWYRRRLSEHFSMTWVSMIRQFSMICSTNKFAIFQILDNLSSDIEDE